MKFLLRFLSIFIPKKANVSKSYPKYSTQYPPNSKSEDLSSDEKVKNRGQNRDSNEVTFAATKEKALESLLQSLLHTTREWSIKYNYDSIPPGILLRQACALIDAAEIAFRDEQKFEDT